MLLLNLWFTLHLFILDSLHTITWGFHSISPKNALRSCSLRYIYIYIIYAISAINKLSFRKISPCNSMDAKIKKGHFDTFHMHWSHVQIYHYISIFLFLELLFLVHSSKYYISLMYCVMCIRCCYPGLFFSVCRHVQLFVKSKSLFLMIFTVEILLVVLYFIMSLLLNVF